MARFGRSVLPMNANQELSTLRRVSAAQRVPQSQGVPPAVGGRRDELVEAAGQLFHLFRDGLDYAFIRCSHDRVPERGVLSESSPVRILVRAPCVGTQP